MDDQVLAESPQWSRSINDVFPWDFRRRVIALCAAIECPGDESGGAFRVMPRHMDLLEVLAEGLALYMIEMRVAPSSIAWSSETVEQDDGACIV